MLQTNRPRVLMVGDDEHRLAQLVLRAMPSATLRHAPNLFEAIADLAHQPHELVFAPASALHQRGEAAISAMRGVAGSARLLLFGEPATEPLSRRLCQVGCDDYLITPVTPDELERVLVEQASPEPQAGESAVESADSPIDSMRLIDPSAMTDLVFDALLAHPGDAINCAIRAINQTLPDGCEARILVPQDQPIPVDAGTMQLSASLVSSTGAEATQSLRLTVPASLAPRGQGTLDVMAGLLGKVAVLQQRHNRLQKLAFTDELTNVFNGRYFKHFLARMLIEARKHRFPVTLFLFDIDNFKSYNDQFGHGVGDDILKQTASLMRRCVRDHDLVARISGDEFAVVFWEKEGPRVPREGAAGIPGRPPSEPRLILERFRKLLATESFTTLGRSGKGELTISGGLAVFPYDAQDMNALIEAADKALMFGAKRSGRNSISLVGGTAASSENPTASIES